MRALLLLGVLTLFIVLNVARVMAAPAYNPVFASYAEQSWRAQAIAAPAFTVGLSDYRDEATSGKTSSAGPETFLQRIILLCGVSLVLAAASVGVRALWISHPVKSLLYEGLE